MELEIAIKAKNVLGDGPIWSQDEESLYWVDIQEKILQCWVPETNLIDTIRYFIILIPHPIQFLPMILTLKMEKFRKNAYSQKPPKITSPMV